MTVGLVQFRLCGDHDSALVFNHSANEQHRVAISRGLLHWATRYIKLHFLFFILALL